MKLVVFSDSHRFPLAMRQIVALEKPDHILFLGDGWEDSVALEQSNPTIPLIRVPGNCDMQPEQPKERLVELYGKRIFLCHGHTLGVKMGLGGLINRGHQLLADVALYGHTHRGEVQYDQGMWIMNPGSVGLNRPPQYGVILIEEDNLRCELRKFEKAVEP